MSTKITTRNLAVIERKIKALEPFETHGSLRATSGGVNETGRLPQAVWDRIPAAWVDQAIYVVWSCGTPIAWAFVDREAPAGEEVAWCYPVVTYSATTSRHQHTVRIAVCDAWGDQRLFRV